MFKPTLNLRLDAIPCAAERRCYRYLKNNGFTRHTHGPRRLKRYMLRVQSTTDKQGDEELLLRDIERFKQREQASTVQNKSIYDDTQAPSESGLGALKDALDKVLIADFFFVCAALAWLVAGVGAKTLLSSSALIDAWFPLWQWVFQPAIGTLMLGALASGAVGQLQKGSDKSS